jgi:hypothetical protein
VRQVFARYTDVPRPMHVTNRQHDVPCAPLPWSCGADAGRIEPTIRVPPQRNHTLERLDLQIELQHHGAQIGEVLLTRCLGLIECLKRHASDRDPLRRREEMRLRRIPRNRRPDLAGIEMHVMDRARLERDRKLDPDRPRADEQYVCLDHERICIT